MEGSEEVETLNFKNPLIVGEAGHGAFPFAGSGPSHRRLVQITGMVDYRRHFDVVNLLPEWPGKTGKGDRFPIREARAAAAMVLELAPNPVLVLCGKRVASAFRLRDVEFLTWRFLAGLIVGVIPHPSGIVRWWNDEANVEAARAFLLEARGIPT